MDDIKKDPFEEYIRQTEPSKRELGYVWYTAMGLQAVDGLETSDYLKNTAKDNIEGRITISEAGRLIERYYEESTEKEYEYPLNGISATIPHLAKFVSRLWQIHAFGEGNTRTTAVFFIKYLRTMGFDVTNDIFAENSWYFRNSLVRANYNDLSKGIRETTEYLELFLKNLLLGESNELKNRYMHIRWNKQKQDIQERKQDISLSKGIRNKTKQHIRDLFEKYGYEEFFGRTEVMQVLQITASPASALINKMLDMNIIYPLKGKGKGKYLFRRD